MIHPVMVAHSGHDRNGNVWCSHPLWPLLGGSSQLDPVVSNPDL